MGGDRAFHARAKQGWTRAQMTDVRDTGRHTVYCDDTLPVGNVAEGLSTFHTVQHYFDRLRDSGMLDIIIETLVMSARLLAGRAAEPTAGMIDSQSAKATEAGGPRGYDAGKKIKGRKRNILIDTEGDLLDAVTPADVQDRAGAPCVIADAQESYSTLARLFVDGGYAGEKTGNSPA